MIWALLVFVAAVLFLASVLVMERVDRWREERWMRDLDKKARPRRPYTLGGAR